MVVSEPGAGNLHCKAQCVATKPQPWQCHVSTLPTTNAPKYHISAEIANVDQTKALSPLALYGVENSFAVRRVPGRDAKLAQLLQTRTRDNTAVSLLDVLAPCGSSGGSPVGLLLGVFDLSKNTQ